MADTNTSNLNLVKPEVGASSDTWGTKLNSNLDALDALFATGPALLVAKGGTGATSAAGARTNLGLGTAATANTGTSGANVPLLNGANTWSVSQTFSAINTFGSGATGVDVVLNGAAGTGRQITYRTNGLNRWVVLARSGPETGANAGSNFAITSYDDAGNYIEDPLLVTRATGATSIKSLFLTNDLAVSEGGTGASTFTAYSVVAAGTTATGAFQSVGTGTSGQVLTSNGAGALPTWQTAAVPANPIPSGTKMLFQQSSAPTGWTKDTTHDNKALRVVSGAAGSGGSVSFTSAFTSRSFSGTTSSVAAGGTVAGHTLTIDQIPSHTHTIGISGNGGGGTTSGGASTLGNTGATGGGQAHSHGFTGTAHDHTFSGSIDMAVQYVDLIIATKD